MQPRRIRREKKTIDVMIAMYCRRHHDAAPGGLCAECGALRDYAMQRIEKCPFCPEKPTCASCPIHCYKADMREAVRKIMAWSGPRMMRRHPMLAVLHVLDGRREVEMPPRRRRTTATPTHNGRVLAPERKEPAKPLR